MRYGELPTLPGRVVSVLPPFNLRRVFLGGIALVVFVLILIVSGEFFEQLDAEEIMVIQAPLSGDLDWYTSPQPISFQTGGTLARLDSIALFAG